MGAQPPHATMLRAATGDGATWATTPNAIIAVIITRSTLPQFICRLVLNVLKGDFIVLLRKFDLFDLKSEFAILLHVFRRSASDFGLASLLPRWRGAADFSHLFNNGKYTKIPFDSVNRAAVAKAGVVLAVTI